jgi:hypothetical protein
MSVQTKVWFNVVTAEIIRVWNEGSQVLSGNELLQRTRSRISSAISPDEWVTALNTFCLPEIKGAMHFLLPLGADAFAINYPELERFQTSELGSQFGPALEMLYGISLEKLRPPAAGLEADWVRWLRERDAAKPGAPGFPRPKGPNTESERARPRDVGDTMEEVRRRSKRETTVAGGAHVILGAEAETTKAKKWWQFWR